MSGGSQHNPNSRQSQLAPGWSPLQLQVASYLVRAPQAHMSAERGVTWHTPTPPHLYHVPPPSGPEPPDPLQAMKASGAGSNSMYRHTATPPDMYRHTPTPPDKHLIRHTPSPGDVKGGSAMSPVDLYPHLGPNRDKLVRPEEMLAYARGGVDLTLGRSSGPAPSPANGAPLSLSVRDAPTINSLIARAQPRPPHARVDALLERLAPSPASPHSVIVHSRAQPTPSPPSSNEDSADSCGAPPGSKRKRKPERTVRLPAPAPAPLAAPPPRPSDRLSPAPPRPAPQENGDADHRDAPHTRRKTRFGSTETIDNIAAMIASTDGPADPAPTGERTASPEREPIGNATEDTPATPVTADGLAGVLGSPERVEPEKEAAKKSPAKTEEKPPAPDAPAVETAAAPRRRSARTSNSESTNAPVESPSEGKPAESEAVEGGSGSGSGEPTAASFVEVENQLEKMFAGIEEGGEVAGDAAGTDAVKGKKRRKIAAPRTAAEKKGSRRAPAGDAGPKKKPGKKETTATPVRRKKPPSKETAGRDAYDSGSNASSGRSRGPYIQIRGPKESPSSVNVVNAPADEDDDRPARAKPDDYRNGSKSRGLHCSTLGMRYDATTADASWICVFCERGPHAGARERSPHPLGDLFGPYSVTVECEEFLALDEATRRRHEGEEGRQVEVWMHEECAVWAPGVVAAGARAWGLAAGVWRARGVRCARCGRAGAGVACGARGCGARAHVWCARSSRWSLEESEYRALCPLHA